MDVIGRGEKVFDAAAVVGTLRVMEGPTDVLDLLDEGAEGVIALVRDAGATFLGPLFHDLAGVICTAGTLRSHIGIVTREFGVPCVMAATFDTEVPSGTAIELDCSGAGSDGLIRG